MELPFWSQAPSQGFPHRSPRVGSLLPCVRSSDTPGLVQLASERLPTTMTSDVSLTARSPAVEVEQPACPPTACRTRRRCIEPPGRPSISSVGIILRGRGSRTPGQRRGREGGDTHPDPAQSCNATTGPEPAPCTALVLRNGLGRRHRPRDVVKAPVKPNPRLGVEVPGSSLKGPRESDLSLHASLCRGLGFVLLRISPRPPRPSPKSLHGTVISRYHTTPSQGALMGPSRA